MREPSPRGDRARLDALAAELAVAEERERRRIALGLHDNVGQMLGIAKVKLGEALAAEPRDEVAAPLVEGRELVARAIAEIRSLTFELSSPVLHELGLEAALESLAERMEKRHGIPCVFKATSPMAEISKERGVLVYAIVRELLWNTVKHAGARQATISMAHDSRGLRIVVVDDGAGFDVPGGLQPGDEGGGLGLPGARQRLEALGGGLEVDSGPDEGTRITLTIPVQP